MKIVWKTDKWIKGVGTGRPGESDNVPDDIARKLIAYGLAIEAKKETGVDPDKPTDKLVDEKEGE